MLCVDSRGPGCAHSDLKRYVSESLVQFLTVSDLGLPPMLCSGNFAESRGEIKFPEISTAILEKVVQYLYYKVRFTNSSQKVPEFVIEPEMALELLMAANFLDC
jgi:hypothetical protein